MLALVVSIALWVYAVTFINPTDTASIYDVRVSFEGTSSLALEGLMITGGDVQFIDIEIAGRRSVLKDLNSGNMEAVADVSYIASTGSYEVSLTVRPPSTVASGDIRVVSRSADRITIEVSERREREIPVELRYDKEQLPAGYDIGEIDYTDFISVSGPAAEVNKIARAVVEVDLSEQKSKINKPMEYVFETVEGEPLQLSKYMTVSAETIGVMMQIMPYKDITLDIELTAGGGLDLDDVTYTITPSTIRVTGSESVLASLPGTIVSKTPIDLAQIEGLDPEALKHQIELPEGVTRWGDSGASTVMVDVQIDIADNIGLLEIPLKDTILHWSNGEAGMEYFYADVDQTIILRGDMTELKQLQSKLENGEEMTSVL